MVNVEKAGRMPPKEEMKMNRKGALVGRSQSRNWRRRRRRRRGEKRRKEKKRTLRTKKRKKRRLRQLWLRKKGCQ